MRQKSGTPKPSADRVVRDIRRKTRKRHSVEEKIRIVLSGLRGEDSIAELCRREGIAQSPYYSWSKEFLEAAEWPTGILAVYIIARPSIRRDYEVVWDEFLLVFLIEISDGGR